MTNVNAYEMPTRALRYDLNIRKEQNHSFRKLIGATASQLKLIVLPADAAL
jgi:hypothetical protein